MIDHHGTIAVNSLEVAQLLGSEAKLYKDIQRGKIKRVQRACPNTTSMVDFETLPEDVQRELARLKGNPYKVARVNSFLSLIETDWDAINYFANIEVAGKRLDAEKQKLLCNEAAILNAVASKMQGVLKHQANGASLRGFWPEAVKAIKAISDEWPNRLPKTVKRLKEKFEGYREQEYIALIKQGNFGNTNRTKVTDDLDRLLNAIYVQSYKPTPVEVWKDYCRFLDGELSIVTTDGELFDATDYEEVSEATVRRTLMRWSNKVGTHKRRSNSRITYNAQYRSYADTVTDYAGSIISMDDRDLPWKMHNGKRPIGYLTLDVASKAFIGWAWTKPSERPNDGQGKNMKLVMNCFRNTFEQLDFYGVKMPAEVEVENHLMGTLSEGTLKEGNLFRYVRYAAAENPQEKEIERAFRVLRYYYDKKQNDGKGWLPRPHARSEANQGRLEDDVKVTYYFEEIIAMAEASIEEYNNSPHPDQKKYKGLSRIEVFVQNQHPKLLPLDWRAISRYVGHHVETSVNRYEVRANNHKYMLEKPEFMDMLGENGKVTAYWMNPETVYLYRNDVYVCRGQLKEAFHKARIEQTPEDKTIMAKRMGYTNHIDRVARERKEKLDKVTLLNNVTVERDKNRETEALPNPEEFTYRSNRKRANRNLLNDI